MVMLILELEAAYITPPEAKALLLLKEQFSRVMGLSDIAYNTPPSLAWLLLKELSLMVTLLEDEYIVPPCRPP